MSNYRNQLLATAAGALLAIGASNAAFAANPPFTFNPGAVDPALTGTEVTSNGLSILADSLTTFSGGGTTFSESGVVEINGYNPGSLSGSALYNPLSPNTTSTYELFLTFNQTGTIAGPPSGGTTTYDINTLNFTLYLAPGNPNVAGGGTINASTCGTIAAPVIGTGLNATTGCTTGTANLASFYQLATGSLSNLGVNTVTQQGSGISSAFSEAFDANLNTTGPNSGFFVDPSPFYTLDVNSLINSGNPSAVSPDGTQVLINGQEGTVIFATAVPEPASMALFGTALFGLGMVRRRKNGSKNA